MFALFNAILIKYDIMNVRPIYVVFAWCNDSQFVKSTLWGPDANFWTVEVSFLGLSPQQKNPKYLKTIAIN